MKKSISFFLLLALAIGAAGQTPQEIAAQINRDSLVKTVRILSGEEPAIIGGTSTLITTRSNSNPALNNKAADYIKERLLRYNLNVVDQNFSSTGRNVIATQTGSGRPDSLFIICAHYDAVTSYCADDNASGVAAALETARLLSAYTFRYTIIYAFFDYEENGQLGSQYYASQAYSRGLKISGVLNIDMIGYDSNNDRKFEIHTNYLTGSQVLKDAMVASVSAGRLSLVPQVINPGATQSDHGPFWNYNYGAVALSELFFGGDGNPYYHTDRDRISAFNLNYFTELSKLAALTTARQAKSPSAVTYYTLTASAGTGGTISPAGSIQVTGGSNQTFTITPSAGYTISGVTVDGTPAGPVTSYTFTNITANHTISASFSPVVVTYNITASAGTGGTISPSGTVTVNSGSNRTFTITPAAGYLISGVTVDGTPAGAVTSYTFNNVTANHTISASFSPVIVTYNITASAGPGGTISPSGTVTVNSGSNQTFNITPAAGFETADVVVDGVSAGAVMAYTFSNVTAVHTISATFRAIPVVTYRITANTTEGGTISPSGAVTVNSGSNQTFTITPAQGYEIEDVFVDGMSAGPVTSYEFKNVTSDHGISAAFAILPTEFPITATAGPGGSINPSGTVSATAGSKQSFTITPDAGYQIADVIIDGVSAGAVPYFEFSNIDSKHTISAEFSLAENIALNKPASGQSYYRAYYPSKANDADGSNSSYWAAYNYPQWWKIDLGAYYDISGIVIRNYVDGRRYYHYTIEASNDDINYFPVTVKSDNNPATDQGDNYTVNLTARYLRVNMTLNSARSGVQISDFRVYGTARTGVILTKPGKGGTISPEGPVLTARGDDQAFNIIPGAGYKLSDVLVDGQSVGPVPVYEFFDVTSDHVLEAVFTPLVSLALNKPTKSQSDFSPWYSSQYANDANGSNTSRWSAYPYPQWWKVDLLGVYNIDGIVVRNYVYWNRWYNYTIEGSLDDQNYFPVAAKTDTKPALDAGDSYAVNTTARYLKVTINYCSGTSGVHMSDFRVYGTLKEGGKEGEASTFLPDIATIPQAKDFIVDLYPNPFSDVFMIRINAPDEELYELSIVDFSGSTRFRQKDVPGNTELEFSPDLEKGVYVLQVKSRKNIEAVRLVKF